MKPVSGDFDGDGINDMTLWDSSNLTGFGLTDMPWFSLAISGRSIAFGLLWGESEHSAIGAQSQ